MTEDTMLEKVAFSLKAEVGRQMKARPLMGDWGSSDWHATSGGSIDLMECARAALEAIRSPSDKSLDAMCENGPDMNDGPFSYAAAQEVWEAGIRAILQERA
jgi:hypothetical protein